MHTFFINTSGNEIENYSDILEIQHETRKLVSLNCPLTKWQHAEEGYRACVSNMGEQIDSYKDINNDFNLIIYVDLTAIKEYAEISMQAHRERFACLQALYAFFKSYMHKTIVNELEACGRSPQDVLIIFEENKKPEDEDIKSEDGRAILHSYMQKFMGLTDCEALASFATEMINQGKNADFSLALSNLLTLFCEPLLPGVQECYIDLLDVFLHEIQEYNGYEEPMIQLFERVLSGYIKDETIKTVFFVTNRRAGITNKQERIRRDLRLSFYIFDCVDSQSIFNYETEPETGITIPRVKTFFDIDWQKVTKQVLTKNCEYKRRYSETVSLSESFVEMELAPTLYALDYEKFSLDSLGKRAKAMEVVDVTPGNSAGDAVVSAEKKAVEISEKTVQCLLSEEVLIPAELTEPGCDETFDPRNASAETLIEEAKKEREGHILHLKNLKLYIMDILSNYAGRSLENEPAMLEKRKVSLAEELQNGAEKKRHYTTEVEAVETKKIDTVLTISDIAYETVVHDYLEFCAGRTVSVTDIEEQCNLFVTQVHQINESLKKTKLIFWGLFALLAVLYLPFFTVQWKEIFSSLLNGFVAFSSIFLPALILFYVCLSLLRRQRKKYVAAWKNFKEKSDKVKAENCLAAKKYSQLLASFIPALRWIYEYKIDVAFYADCCKLAKAKINHHIQKLQGRVTTIKNIIDDLEIDESTISEFTIPEFKTTAKQAIDYNVSYCSNRKNQEFYSIISRDFLDAVKKQEEDKR